MTPREIRIGVGDHSDHAHFPTPDAKGAQPEQLVEEARRLAGWSDFDVQRVEWGEMLTHLHARNEVLDALATALSECRERLSQIRPLTDDERAWQYAGDDVIHEARQVSVSVPKLDAALKKYDEARERALAGQPPSEASERTP